MLTLHPWRARGWRRALAESGIELAEGWHVFSEYEIEPARGDAAAIFALSPQPTAVFAGSDAIALGVMYQARERGLAIPAELSLVGFDSMPITELLGPPLTSVGQPIDGLGRLGAERLVAMIEGTAVASNEETRLPVSLVERGSVAAPREKS